MEGDTALQTVDDRRSAPHNLTAGLRMRIYSGPMDEDRRGKKGGEETVR